MITANYNDYADGGSHKDFEISIVGEQTVIDNSKMLSESIKLQEALCSEQNLRFGACEASQFTVQVANTAGNFKGKTLEVAVTMDEATTKYGTFKVQSDKPTADRIWRVLTAYDTMYDIINADVLEWYSSLTFPMTLANFRNSFFAYLGVTQKSTTLINDSFVIQGGFTATGALSGKTIINAICEFNGVFGHINRDGNFEYISLDGADSFNCPPYENNSVTYEDYVTEAITKVTMKGSADDVGTSVGTDGNEYIIINNPLIYGTEGTQALITALTNLLNKISLVTYRPYSLNKTIGNPCVELGDAIVISTKYQTINSYVIKRVLSGIQALRDNYSATGDKTYPKEVNTIQSQINRIAGKTSELSYTVDGLQSTVTSVQQTANTALTRANGSITTDTLHYLATPLSSGVTTETAGWTTTPQSMTPTNKYLWTYHTYTYADAHTSNTTPVITGVYGEDGQQGQTGPQGPAGPTGADGLSITEVTSIYYASDSSTAPTAPTSEVTTTSTSVYNTWTKGVPALTSTYNKLYTCDQVKYSNNTFTWTTPVLQNAITTAVSEINQLADQIVLKVDNNGNIVKVALDASASTGTTFKVSADNISFIANGVIDLTADALAVKTTNFNMDQNGNITLNNGGILYIDAGNGMNATGIMVSGGGTSVNYTEMSINGFVAHNGFHVDQEIYECVIDCTPVLNSYGNPTGSYHSTLVLSYYDTTLIPDEGEEEVDNYKSLTLTETGIELKIGDINYPSTQRTLFSVSANGNVTAPNLITTSNIGTQSVANATKWNGAVYDMSTLNTTDTWIPVLSSGKFQHCMRELWTSVQHCDWNNTNRRSYLATLSCLAFWNGAYNANGSSNLAYCNKGAFGTVVTKNTGDVVLTYTDNTFYTAARMVTFKGSNNALVGGGKGNYIWGISSWSDSRLKKNIKDSEVNALDLINKIQMREFDFKDEKYGKHEDIGYVAQELKEVIPECVVDIPISEEEQKEYKTDTLMQVEDKHLIKYLVKAVQELSKEVERLKNGGN